MKTIRMAGLVGAVGVSLIVGLALGSAANAAGDVSPEPKPSLVNPVPVFKTNDAGQSYGSNAASRSVEDGPDLVLVVGDRGREGYVEAIALDPPAPSSPEEALATQPSPGTKTQLPVYASDGKTQIDTFTIETGEGKTATAR